MDFFDCFDGEKLHTSNSGSTQSISRVSIHQCAQKCVEGTSGDLREGECLSFTYDKPASTCTLNTNNRATSNANLDTDRDYEYCEMKDILSFFQTSPGYMQAGHDDLIVRPPEITPRICALRCLRRADKRRYPAGFCLSFDIGSTRPDSCLLSTDTPETTGLPLLYNPRFDYYQRNIEGTCFNYPCVHGYCASQDDGVTCICDAGYGGDTCDTACTAGTFGPGCTETCHCAGGISMCDVYTGECSTGGCIIGWSGPNCQTACPPGQFGLGCNNTCHCASGHSVCDTENGNCSSGGCVTGWEGSNCQTACPAGQFGLGCTGTCHCASGGSVCDTETGNCSSGGCSAGWEGSNCQTACPFGQFGPGCTGTCHCASGGSVCDTETGNCSSGGCSAGWEGSNCQTACPLGQFGLGCTGTCHCASGGSVCDTETGNCSSGGCSAGWEGSNCQTACPFGQFGPDCNGTCHCASGGSVCDTETGVCSSGDCSAGWEGNNCQTACPAGQFGLGCTGTCHCASGGSVCDTETGVCSSGGCSAGWEGINCQTALIRKRQTAYRHGQSHLYKFLRNRITRLISTCKKNYYTDYIEQLKNTKTAQWHKTIRRMANWSRPSSTIHVPGVEPDDTSGAAHAINRHLATICQALPPLDYSMLPAYLPALPPPQINPWDMYLRLQRVKTSKAPGPDLIPPELIKEFAYELSVPLTDILNTSLREGTVPDMWRDATVIPVPKEHPADLTKIRPISLTAQFAKICESFVSTWIFSDIAPNVDSKQFGNIKCCSTTHCLVDLLNFFYMGGEKKGTVGTLILTDFSKAFDRVCHTTAINKLLTMGTRASLIPWLCSFMSNRRQRVRYQNSMSDWETLTSGVAQGTLLGPLVFLAMINDATPTTNNPHWNIQICKVCPLAAPSPQPATQHAAQAHPALQTANWYQAVPH
ncbi:uncharacterized protein LOC144861620 [Branchiostoma floridae x Branchiostoma japonicum]